MAKELKPCPFCGGEAELDILFDYNGNIFAANIYCTSCNARTQSYGAKEGAIEAWNRRDFDKEQHTR